MKHAKNLTVTILTILLAVGSILLLIFLSRGCSDEGSGYRSATLFAMDTTLEFTIHERDEQKAEQDVEAALELALQIESHTSRFDTESDVSIMNENAGEAPAKVHPETLEIIERSLEYARLTDGAFDITVAPLAELWGFYDGDYRVPSQDEIDGAKSLIDYSKVVVDPVAGSVMLAEPGMQIDLGGVAKGYAVRAMCELLRERGVKSGLVNFGGTVCAIDSRSDGQPWVIGIKHPREEGGALVGELAVSDAYVASSGDYERFFIEDGHRYFHIFDPATGRQPEGVISVTVVGPDPIDADILSTALLVMGTEKGLELIEGLDGFEAVIIDSEGKSWLSTGMPEYVLELKEQI